MLTRTAASFQCNSANTGLIARGVTPLTTPDLRSEVQLLSVMRVGSAAVSVLAVLSLAIGCSVQASDLIEPFPLSAVRLAPDSEFDKAQSLNVEYMLSLEEDDLLRTFRENAKLPAPGMPYSGSWEDSVCEVRGQFMGHYLSALAFLANHTGAWSSLRHMHFCEPARPCVCNQQVMLCSLQATARSCHVLSS